MSLTRAQHQPRWRDRPNRTPEPDLLPPAATDCAIRSTALVATLLLAAACSESPPLTDLERSSPGPTAAGNASQDSRFEITATIRELMDRMVDPAADGLWNSVATVYTRTRVYHKQPRTDAEWKTVRGQAVTLMESMNLLAMDSRRAAPPGSVPGEGELTPAQIDQRIAASRAAFVGFAQVLRVASEKALIAIDKKDAGGLFDAGGDIEEACEACHATFWYPNQKVPAN
jgi:cytochrome c556